MEASNKRCQRVKWSIQRVFGSKGASTTTFSVSGSLCKHNEYLFSTLHWDKSLLRSSSWKEFNLDVLQLAVYHPFREAIFDDRFICYNQMPKMNCYLFNWIPLKRDKQFHDQNKEVLVKIFPSSRNEATNNIEITRWMPWKPRWWVN